MASTRDIIVLNLAIILIYVGYSICDESETELKTVEIKLKQGALSGKVVESFFKQKEYFAFRGIPYAEPPLGSLRFQPPKPYNSWKGTYKAHDKKPTCLQFCTRERNNEPFGLSGSEDCLYLSVFTPSLEGNYPVVVFDYNDNYRTGFNGSDTYSPDFFIENDVIVVMITHRLGILGYLTTEDEVIPSNNGLRDFILGLHWVKNNIEKFGGDPTRVTLMGSRGGAALAEILLYSKQAVGLFSAVIMQSGSALETLYFYENPRAKAFELGEAVDIKTDDSKTLLDELQKHDVEQLLLTELKIRDTEGLETKHMTRSIFVPTLENQHDSAIITSLPEKGKVVNDVPVLIGLTSREGLDLAQHFLFEPRMFEKALSSITMNLPIRVDFRFDRNSLIYNRNASNEINEVYYKDGYLHVGNLLEYTTYIGDVLHGYAIDKAAKALARNLESPVFYYMFDYRGFINENSEYMARYSRYNIQHWGATITDDLCYLHLCARKKTTYEYLLKLVTEQHDFKILKKMVKLWTNFAKIRNPTPDEEDNIIKGIKWHPIDKQEQDAQYMHISKKFTMKKEPLEHRAKFWDEFLDKYSQIAVDGVVTDKEEEGYVSVPERNRRDTGLLNEEQSESHKDEIDIQINEDEATPVPLQIQETEFGNIVIIEDAKVTVVKNDGHEPVNLPYEETRDEL